MESRTICFTFDTASFALEYPSALEELSTVNLRKLFRLMLTDTNWPPRNEDAIRYTAEYLTGLIAETKEAWDQASRDYQNSYVDVAYYSRSHSAKETQKAKRYNTELIGAVKRTKKTHERAKTLQAAFAELKVKYGVQP